MEKGGSDNSGSESDNVTDTTTPAVTNPTGTGSGRNPAAKPGKIDNNAGQGTVKDADTTDSQTQTGDDSRDNTNQSEQPSEDGADAANTENSSKTVEAELVDTVSKEKTEQYRDALQEIQKLLPEIKAGSYVLIPDDGREETQITLQIPEELQAEGRTFYLLTVDADGYVVIRKNESLEEGMLTATGTPGTTYRIIYEDGTNLLGSMLTEDGRLQDADGKQIRVATNHCFWHWIILVVALAGILLTFFRRKHYKQQFMILGSAVVLMVLCMIPGWCIWDGMLTLWGALAMAAIILPEYLLDRKDRMKQNQ